MNEEKRQRLIDELNGLRSGDREGDHIAADDILKVIGLLSPLTTIPRRESDGGKRNGSH